MFISEQLSVSHIKSYEVLTMFRFSKMLLFRASATVLCSINTKYCRYCLMALIGVRVLNITNKDNSVSLFSLYKNPLNKKLT